MARAIHWQLDFASKNGHSYSVNLWDEDYAGDVVSLRGGSVPFETREKDENDLFSSVFTQDGYIRFVAIDNALLESIYGKEQLYVTLTDENDVIRWMGYTRCEAIGDSWDAFPKLANVPVDSCVRMLSEKPYTVANDYLSVREILDKIFSSLDCDWGTLYLPKRGNADCDLDCMVYDGVFVTNIEKEAWVQHPGVGGNIALPKDVYSCYDVLSDLCDYFGWSLHENGQDIELSSANGDGNYWKIDISDLSGSVSAESHTAAVGVFPRVAGTKHTRDVDSGCGIVNITETLHLPAPPFDMDLSHYPRMNGDEVRSGSPGYWVLVDMTTEILFYQWGQWDTEEHTWRDFLLHPNYINCGGMLARLAMTEDFLTFTGTPEKSQDFDSTYIIKHDPDANPQTRDAIRFYKPFARSLAYRGGLSLHAQVKHYIDGTGWTTEPEFSLICKMKWGDKYLYGAYNTGYEWVSNSNAVFSIMCKGGSICGGRFLIYDGPLAQIWRTPDDMVYIPVDDDMSGELVFKICCSPKSSTTVDITALQNLELEAYYTNETIIKGEWDLSHNIFRAKQSDNQSVWSRDNLLCSKMADGQQSDAIVLDDQHAPLADVPETGLLSRLHDWHGGKIEKLTVSLYHGAINYLNAYKFYEHQNGTEKYWVSGVKRDWRGHDMNVTMFRKI